MTAACVVATPMQHRTMWHISFCGLCGYCDNFWSWNFTRCLRVNPRYVGMDVMSCKTKKKQTKGERERRKEREREMKIKIIKKTELFFSFFVLSLRHKMNGGNFNKTKRWRTFSSIGVGKSETFRMFIYASRQCKLNVAD